MTKMNILDQTDAESKTFPQRIFHRLYIFCILHFSPQVIKYNWYLLQSLMNGEKIHIYMLWGGYVPYVGGVSHFDHLEAVTREIHELEESLPRHELIQKVLELAHENFRFIIFTLPSNQKHFVQFHLESGPYLLDVPQTKLNKSLKPLSKIEKIYRDRGFMKTAAAKNRRKKVHQYWISRDNSNIKTIDIFFLDPCEAAIVADTILTKVFRSNEQVEVVIGDEIE